MFNETLRARLQLRHHADAPIQVISKRRHAALGAEQTLPRASGTRQVPNGGSGAVPQGDSHESAWTLLIARSGRRLASVRAHRTLGCRRPRRTPNIPTPTILDRRQAGVPERRGLMFGKYPL